MLDTHQQGFAKLVAMIEALDVGMLTTEDENGHLRSRPMATQRAEEGVLWFFTGKDSPKIEEVKKDAQVNVSYADPNNQVYVSVSGPARAFVIRQRSASYGAARLSGGFRKDRMIRI